MLILLLLSVFYRALMPSFFFNDTATTEIYTLSLHDALPISPTLTTNGWPTLLVRLGVFSTPSLLSWRRAAASGPPTAGIASRPCAALELNPSRLWSSQNARSRGRSWL